VVEIVMPVYNTGALLHRAIKSVVSQTYLDWHLWIVDDCSTELTTKAILDLYEMINNPQITVVRKKSNSGPSITRNTALALIELDSLVAYCDSDDYWHSDHLSEKTRHINDGFDMVYCNPILKNEEGYEMYPMFNLYDDFRWERLQKGNFIFTPTVLHKNGLGFFDPTLDGLEDYDYWIRAVKAGYIIHQSDMKTCTCTVRSKGNNNMSSRGQAALPKIKLKHKDFFNEKIL